MFNSDEMTGCDVFEKRQVDYFYQSSLYNEELFIRKKSVSKNADPGGGVTTIYEGTGCAIFWGAFFPAENKF